VTTDQLLITRHTAEWSHAWARV